MFMSLLWLRFQSYLSVLAFVLVSLACPGLTLWLLFWYHPYAYFMTNLYQILNKGSTLWFSFHCPSLCRMCISMLYHVTWFLFLLNDYCCDPCLPLRMIMVAVYSVNCLDMLLAYWCQFLLIPLNAHFHLMPTVIILDLCIYIYMDELTSIALSHIYIYIWMS